MKTTGGDETGSTLTFDKTEVNIGASMSIKSGEFKAPFSGTYSFDFSALSQDKRKTVHIQIKKNNIVINNIYNHLNEESTQRFDNMNYHWMLTLSTGDIITLYLANGKLYTSSTFPVIFSGHLLHLDE